uniref:Uncharacterized protein n=1 Tax=Marmota marmota marmota TaxID=9994 RepID=A0A8C5YQM9_MARMA
LRKHSCSLKIPYPMEEYSRKAAIYKPGRRPLSTQSCWQAGIGIPLSRTVRNTCLLCKPHSLWYFC